MWITVETGIRHKEFIRHGDNIEFICGEVRTEQELNNLYIIVFAKGKCESCKRYLKNRQRNYIIY